MNIVLLESLGITAEVLDKHVQPLLAAGHTFKAYAKTLDIEILKDEVKDADVLMLANMPLKGEVIRAAQNLKYIDIAFTGVDHVDLAAAKEMGARASNASGYSNESVAELAVCMMLMLLRNVPQVDERCRQGKTKDGLVGVELKGKTVGLVGTGAIGQRTAEILRAFGCRIIAADTFGGRRPGKPEYIEYMPLNDMLEQADIISLHCPLTDVNKHFVNAEMIAKMKDGAWLINTARGPLVVEQDLADALHSGKLGGVAVDVVEVEPMREASPLMSAPNSIITPHVAWAPDQARQRLINVAGSNIGAFIKGSPENVVNP